MMRLAEIEARISGMRDLQNIVGALRSLAGMRMQEAEAALPGIGRFAHSVASGIADTMLLVSEPESSPLETARPRALVLCAAEHGFVGGFNDRLVDSGLNALAADDVLLVLGSRGAALAAERGRAPAWRHPLATRAAAAPEIARRLSSELYRRIAGAEVGRVEVMFASHGQGTVVEIERRLLLPLDMTTLRARQTRQPPLHNLRPQLLYEKLLAEYVFARLSEAIVEAIAAENAARLAAMGSAHDNVSRKLEALYRDARYARQSEITAEVVDIVTGAEAQTE